MVTSRRPEVPKSPHLSPDKGSGDRGRPALRIAPSEGRSDIPHAPLLGSETVPTTHTPEGVNHEQTAHTLEEPAAVAAALTLCCTADTVASSGGGSSLSQGAGLHTRARACFLSPSSLSASAPQVLREPSLQASPSYIFSCVRWPYGGGSVAELLVREFERLQLAEPLRK
jgi:hypothetical protein